jgi:hypothetical protein
MTPHFTRAQIVLLVLCGGLGILLAYELFAPLREYRPPAVDAPHRTYAVETPALYSVPAFDAFANIDERSVFNPLRTRVASASDIGNETAAGDNLPPDLALIGVILDGQTKMALLKSSAAPMVVGVPQGGTIEGWQVADVLPDRVVFAAHGSRQELKLSDNKPNRATIAQGKTNGDDQ